MSHVNNSAAIAELIRIKRLSAFNVNGYTKKRKVNQYQTRYEFIDGSYLIIRHYSSIASAHMGATLAYERIQTNARGN